MYHRMSGISFLSKKICVNNNGHETETVIMLVNIDEEGKCLVAMRYPTTIIILLKVCSSSPLLNHIAKSTHSTSSLKLCRYKKPGCVLVAANTAAQII